MSIIPVELIMRNKAIVKSLLLKLPSLDLHRSSITLSHKERAGKLLILILSLPELGTADQELHVLTHEANSSILRFLTGFFLIKQISE